MTVDSGPDPEGPHERFPVFVDDTGRRHRWLRVAGWIVGVLAAAYVGLFVASIVGSPGLIPLSLPGVGRLVPNAAAPDIGVPGHGRQRPDVVVATTTPTPPPAIPGTAAPTPSPSASRPGPSPTVTPTPTRTRGRSPSPSATASPTSRGSPTAKPSPHGTGKPTAHPTRSARGALRSESSS